MRWFGRQHRLSLQRARHHWISRRLYEEEDVAEHEDDDLADHEEDEVADHAEGDGADYEEDDVADDGAASDGRRIEPGAPA